MSLIVQKFGGTSVGSIERIEQVAEKVAKFRNQGDAVVVVVSAMSGETNRLIEMAHEVQERPTPREMDVLVSTGEQVTTALLSMALNKRGVKAKSYNGSQVRILTDNAHTKARIKEIDDKRLHAALDDGYVIVVAGFQGVDEHGNITTLGRGGSDTTAVALAAALKADECQIYTDVDGVYTTDPRVVDGARRLDKITFEEMLEMASMGSRVLQIRAVEFAGKYNVPLRVLPLRCLFPGREGRPEVYGPLPAPDQYPSCRGAAPRGARNLRISSPIGPHPGNRPLLPSCRPPFVDSVRRGRTGHPQSPGKPPHASHHVSFIAGGSACQKRNLCGSGRRAPPVPESGTKLAKFRPGAEYVGPIGTPPSQGKQDRRGGAVTDPAFPIHFLGEHPAACTRPGIGSYLSKIQSWGVSYA